LTKGFDYVNISISKNLFGDITDIYYGSTRVASYKYDAWGNCEVENFPLEGTDEDFSIGNLNPFRYRGYYWCEALQMYHLQTRWYDPTIGRFISPDSYEYLDPETIGGLNLYAYCLNNPIMYTDPSGNMPEWAKWLIGGGAFTAALLLTAFTGGALAPMFIQMGSSIVLGGLTQGVVNTINGENFWEGFVEGAANGALTGGIFALGQSLFRVIRVANYASKGLTIGKGVTYKEVAKLSGTAYYDGLKSHRVLSKIFGKNFADKVGWIQNKSLIRGVMKFKGVIYDVGGKLVGVNTSNGVYFYHRDILGNITGIFDSEGDYVVKYNYDAWGVPTQTITQGCESLDVIHNPFMFKGYFYDEETGFYYLKSRYYAPVIGRFISMDAITYMDVNSFNGVNLYSYCNNNPVMYADENGNFPTWAIIVAGVIAVCAIVAAIVIVKHVEEDIIPAAKKVLHTIDKGIKNIKNSLISDYNSLKNIITTGLERGYNSTRNFFVNTWGSIKEYATNAWDSVSGFFVDAWTSVSEFFVKEEQSTLNGENTDSSNLNNAEESYQIEVKKEFIQSLAEGATSISNAVVGSGCNYGFGGGAFKLAYANKNDWDVQSLLFKPYW